MVWKSIFWLFFGILATCYNKCNMAENSTFSKEAIPYIVGNEKFVIISYCLWRGGLKIKVLPDSSQKGTCHSHWKWIKTKTRQLRLDSQSSFQVTFRHRVQIAWCIFCLCNVHGTWHRLQKTVFISIVLIWISFFVKICSFQQTISNFLFFNPDPSILPWHFRCSHTVQGLLLLNSGGGGSSIMCWRGHR